MTVLVNQILKSEFVANFSKLFAGRGIGAVITLGTAPIIARLYTPADYGVIGIFVSICGVLTILATLRYETAIVLPESDTTARAVFLATIGLSLLFSLLVTALIAIGLPFMQDVEVMQLLGNYVWLLPPAIFLAACANSINRWLVRTKEFGRMAAADVTMTATTALTRIGAGIIAGSTLVWLVLSFLLGIIVKLILVRPQLQQALQAVQQPQREVLTALKQYADFPKYTMPADFVRGLAQKTPLLVFGFMYSPVIAGLYYMSYRLVFMPVELLLQAFRSVYLQKIVALKNTDQPLRSTYIHAVGVMAAIGILPMAVIAVFGQEILTFILGSDWTEAGRFAEILSPLLFSFWVSSPAAMWLVVLRKQNYWLAVQVLIASLQLLALIFAHYTGKPVGWAIGSIVLIQFSVNIGMKVLVLELIGRAEAQIP